ncbi:hypothetical protein H4S14_001072 [Agrobacterium vitis]|nr:hypothetical protein [Agrobacterium vitis]MBE1437341.1 hypothetical protein [Agrobacterium vitis]
MSTSRKRKSTAHVENPRNLFASKVFRIGRFLKE